ncbi:MAG: cell division protein ZapB [Acidobacteriota bacterium]|nr:cell division protein ZapB [Acidobacteriota bacterium]
MATSTTENLDWLKELEKRVSAVVGEVAELRKKNRSLVAKITRLERQARGRSEAEESEWAATRVDLKDRVEKLAGNLETLLDDQ